MKKIIIYSLFILLFANTGCKFYSEGGSYYEISDAKGGTLITKKDLLYHDIEQFGFEVIFRYRYIDFSRNNDEYQKGWYSKNLEYWKTNPPSWRYGYLDELATVVTGAGVCIGLYEIYRSYYGPKVYGYVPANTEFKILSIGGFSNFFNGWAAIKVMDKDGNIFYFKPMGIRIFENSNYKIILPK